ISQRTFPGSLKLRNTADERISMHRGWVTRAAGVAKPMVIGVAGEKRCLKLRRYGLRRLQGFNRRRQTIERLKSEKRGFTLNREVTRHGGLLSGRVDEMTPADAGKANFDLTVDALGAHEVKWWLVQDYSGHGYRIGVHVKDRPRVTTALVRRGLTMPIYVRSARPA